MISVSQDNIFGERNAVDTRKTLVLFFARQGERFVPSFFQIFPQNSILGDRELFQFGTSFGVYVALDGHGCYELRKRLQLGLNFVHGTVHIAEISFIPRMDGGESNDAHLVGATIVRDGEDKRGHAVGCIGPEAGMLGIHLVVAMRRESRVRRGVEGIRIEE